jgi:repressor LexA
MSDKPLHILAFIRDFILERGYSPTIGEIQKGCKICSKSVVKYHLEALERQRQVRREPGVSRGIRLSGTGGGGWPVPIVGQFEVGQPLPDPDQEYSMSHGMVEVPLDFVRGKGVVFALKVKGSSLYDALLDDGDVIIVRAQNTANDGDLIAGWLALHEQMVLKKLYRVAGRVKLQSVNRNRKPIFVDDHQFQVKGKVLAVLRRMS